MLLTHSVGFPCLNGVEELARPLRVLTAVDVKMERDGLTYLQVQFLNLRITHVEHHASRVLPVFVFDDVGLSRPLVASLLTYSRLALEHLNDCSCYYNIHKLLTLKKCVYTIYHSYSYMSPRFQGIYISGFPMCCISPRILRYLHLLGGWKSATTCCISPRFSRYLHQYIYPHAVSAVYHLDFQGVYIKCDRHYNCG